MTVDVAGLWRQGGHGIVRDGTDWYLVSVDHEWVPRRLADDSVAARWALIFPADVPIGARFDTLGEAARWIRDQSEPMLPRTTVALEDVLELLPPVPTVAGSPNPLTEELLHARMLLGDEQAFREWQELQRPGVVGMLWRMGLAEPDSEEVWNDAFFALARRLRRVPPLTPRGQGLRFYLYGAARRMAIRRLAEQREQRQISIDALPFDPSEPADAPAADPRPMNDLRECIRAMPAGRTRDVAHLLAFGMSPGEISDVLEIPANQVPVYKQRAVRALRSCMEARSGP